MYLLKSYDIFSELVRDPIYTFIEIPNIFNNVVDHQLFQRLRWISQLPLEQLVYPSSQHSRFEHSLGVMHLAMQASISIINNSSNELSKAFEKDEDFKKLRKLEDKNKQFILAAGLSALLHDIGHAPFSHTLEEACKYSKIKYKYDHEEVGYFLSDYLINDAKLIDQVFAKKTLRVLNKKFKVKKNELTSLEEIIRVLIDGPIDVDKGDYIIRDSYHCGTTYGIYDVQRLWRNIIIIPDELSVAVDEKGAIEAWTLRIQRYKMYKNVYKHHTRNITDSMLIDIISTSLDESLENNKKDFDLIPIWDKVEELLTDDILTHFIYWTDNTILRQIALSKNSVHHRIESFLKRDLYKRGFEIDLSKYSEVYGIFSKGGDINKRLEIRLELRKLKKRLHKEKSFDFDFLIEKVTLPPVNEKEVQIELRVNTKERGLLTLAKYLEIDTTNKNSEEFIETEKHFLYIFISKSTISSQHNKDIIKNEVENILNKYNVNPLSQHNKA